MPVEIYYSVLTRRFRMREWTGTKHDAHHSHHPSYATARRELTRIQDPDTALAELERVFADFMSRTVVAS